MHIPACDTAELDILSFDAALAASSGGYDRERWLYVPDFYAEYRYILGTRGKKPLIKPLGWHRHWKDGRTKVVYTE